MLLSGFVNQWKTDAREVLENEAARLVAQGFREVEPVEYFETFTPTSNPAFVRLVAALASRLGP